MNLYILLVVNLSIFTLSIQLIYCASIYSNTNIESICSYAPEKFIQENGSGSSLTFDLYPGITHGTCKRLITAPDQHGFFIRLYRTKSLLINEQQLLLQQQQNNNHQQQQQFMKNKNRLHTTTANMNLDNINVGNIKTFFNNNNSNNNNNNNNNSNNTATASDSCPLSIYNLNDPLLPPWRIDPCQLEAQGGFEEPVRLLQGRLRIVWTHNNHKPAYRLMVTVLGRGAPCLENEKHPCLKLGDDVLFCISKDLTCDGIEHCPIGSEYDSDEDSKLCEDKQSLENNKNNNSNNNYKFDLSALERFSFEVLKSLFKPSTSVDIPTTITTTSKIPISYKEEEFVNNSNNDKNIITKFIHNNDQNKKNINNKINRNSLTRGLSRYGPWGYLMLGMLICGSALLICGLWECCCRHHKPQDITDDDDSHIDTIPGVIQTTTPVEPVTPPNYDELDPPPSYSVLFPTQKLVNSNILCQNQPSQPIDNQHNVQIIEQTPEQSTSS